ncbi:MAG TPA: hypothetical protein VN704_04820 [Verrucomicrobiae bacterium]|nr:hypothetical protein [Verrucomicrobiae bacterium]
MAKIKVECEIDTDDFEAYYGKEFTDEQIEKIRNYLSDAETILSYELRNYLEDGLDEE